MIRFACPGCGGKFTVPDEKAGKVSKCPKCGASFTIPEPYSPPPLPAEHSPSANDPIEIRPCPKCQSRLSVLAADVGSEIECPSCRTVYKATRADAPLPPPGGDAGPVAPSSKLVRLGSGPQIRDDESDEKSRRRKRPRRFDEDDEEDDEDYAAPKPVKRRGGGARSKGWRTISAVGVLSCGKVMGAVYAILGLLYALIAGAFLLLGAAGLARLGGTEAAVGLFSWTVCLLILTPLLWGVGGFIGGVLMAFLYNVVAGWVGGIEMELE